MENGHHEETSTADAALRFLREQKTAKAETPQSAGVEQPVTDERQLAAQLAREMDDIARMIYQRVSKKHPYLSVKSGEG